jgi:hypothetical protein
MMGGPGAPPGARFDPFGPPDIGGFGGMGPMGGAGFPGGAGMGRQRPREIPDRDLFRPPRGDDMFM